MALKKFLPACVFAAALFFVCSFEWIYIHRLRSEAARDLPQVWAEQTLNGRTQMLLPWVLGEQDLYADKVHQVRLHKTPVDPFILENRRFSDLSSDLITFYFTALITFPFKDLATGWAWSSYFLFTVWYLLMSALFKTVFSDEVSPWAVAAVALIPLCLGDAFRSLYFDFSVPSVGKWLWEIFNFGFYKRALEMLRMVSPLVTLFFWSLWFFIFLKIFARAEVKKTAAFLAGALCGALAGVHFFEWSSAMGLLSLLCVLSFVDPRLRSRRAPLLWSFLGAALGSAVFLLLLHHGAGAEVVERTGIYKARVFDRASWFLLLSAAGCYWVGKISAPEQKSFFWFSLGCGLVAGFCLTNASLITGVYLQNFLFYRPAYFVLSLAVSAGILEAARKWHWPKRHFVGAGILLLALTFFNVKSFAEKHYRVCGLPADWDAAIAWVNQNTSQDAVFATLSPALTRVLPAQTAAKLWVADGFPVISKISTAENLRRLAQVMNTFEVDPQKFFAAKFFGPPEPAMEELRVTGNAPIAALDSFWHVVLGHAMPMETLRQFPGEIERLLPQAQKVPRGTFLWVNSDDEALLQKPSGEHSSWALCYENKSVKIYKIVS